MSVEDLRVRRDPVRPGISIGHEKLKGGTLTAIVTNALGDILALSSLHVLQRKKNERGAKVIQPGKRDQSIRRPPVVGRVVDGYLGLDGDCSVALIENRDIDTRVMEVAIAPETIGRVADGDLVLKVGRSTGLTIGRVRAAQYTNRITYRGRLRTVRVNGFVVEPDFAYPPSGGRISRGGDSGAPYFRFHNDTASTELVGIHTSNVSSNPTWAFACHAENVFERLGIELA